MYKTTYLANQKQKNQLSVLRNICTKAQQLNIKYSVFGGYGLDGLVGVLTRDHHDIDILVLENDRLKFKEILQELGFSLTRESESKEVFKNAELEDFQIELLKSNRLEEFMKVGKNEIFTTNPKGKLGDVLFYTPTVKGHEFIYVIQAKRAVERHWSSNYRHEENRKALINYLKKELI